MRIANWSIPGITSSKRHIRRDRQRRLFEWLRGRRPRIDVVALQKVGLEAEFPSSALREIDYRCVVNGKAFRGDFGVAILSHLDLPAPEERFRVLRGAERDGSRLLTVEIGGLSFSSIYAPYGKPKWWAEELGSKRLGCEKAIDERVVWLQRLRSHIDNQGCARRDSLFCGDFNVKTKSDGPPTGCAYSEREQDELENLLSLGFIDLYDEYRRKHPEAGRGCTFYFTEKCRKGNSRLHLAIASNRLANRVQRVWVDTEFAIPKRAAPLVVELDSSPV